MKTILMTNSYKGEPLSIVESTVPEGFRLMFLSAQTEEALSESIPDADYILAGGRLKISADALEKAGKLKMIQRSGVGLDAIDLEAMKQKNIPLYVNQGVNAESVAEHALLLILSSLRKLTVINDNTKKGIWNKQAQGVQTRELKGKTVGLIGMGNIAKRLVELLMPFDVRIIYYDIIRSDVEAEYVSLKELFESSDIISIHCALTDETRNLINADAISKMKKGVIIVNTSRGGIVNSSDLAEALKNGDVAFAGIDVHDEEPITDKYPLTELDNAILTPHIAGVTYESFHEMMARAMNNIEKFDKGETEDIECSRYQ